MKKLFCLLVAVLIVSCGVDIPTERAIKIEKRADGLFQGTYSKIVGSHYCPCSFAPQFQCLYFNDQTWSQRQVVGPPAPGGGHGTATELTLTAIDPTPSTGLVTVQCPPTNLTANPVRWGEWQRNALPVTCWLMSHEANGPQKLASTTIVSTGLGYAPANSFHGDVWSVAYSPSSPAIPGVCAPTAILLLP